MRAPTLLTSAALVGALVAPAAAEAAPSPADAAVITKTQAQKLANAGVVKKTDVRGFTAQKYVADPSDDQFDQELYQCLGGKPPKEVASKHGPTLFKDNVRIGSSAWVISTVKGAKADAKLSQSPKAPRCLKKAMTASIERDGGVVELIRLKPITMTVAGADVAFGIRYEIYAAVDDVSISMLGYDLNALVGQTELNVGSSRYNGPFPNLTQSKALLAKTVKRVRALT
ncbi:hypothetical protein [Sporichthya polymorpha]|uniref:hypothetical protein n=1 Tax=Sporichthya polymorpha TaxID=35751 RepID=UPI000365F8F3|nr:hypothetical protein [Sporichthya polymorpha]